MIIQVLFAVNCEATQDGSNVIRLGNLADSRRLRILKEDDATPLSPPIEDFGPDEVASVLSYLFTGGESIGAMRKHSYVIRSIVRL